MNIRKAYNFIKKSEIGREISDLKNLFLSCAVVMIAVFVAYAVVMAEAQAPESASDLENPVDTLPVSQDMAASADKKSEREEMLLKADKLSRGHFYDEALEILRSLPAIEPPDPDEGFVKAKIDVIERAKASLIKYSGPIHHVFFHSLIIYPELAFDKKRGSSPEGYNMWMTTVSEFKKMLPLLRDGNYILYNLTDFIESDDLKPEKVKLKDIILPPGKIPLVISIDDVSYYEYMKLDGFATRLVVSDDGRVYTQVTTPEGETELTRDGDVMPILDDFVDENPEFSWRGAKGTIALTGFQGALGYRIWSKNTDEENAIATAQAKIVADALKSNGWLFACHSYGHSAFFRDGSMTLAKLKADTEKWKKTIEPVTGETNLYISPYGVSMIFNPNAYSKYLVQSGFNVLCHVGERKEIYHHGSYIAMPRLDLDGFKMIKGKRAISKYYFDPDIVLDPARPPMK
ncbi:MAG: hypothetical protein FWG09_01340 [Synergistaceae bacterium]|nr:hypothetical protein [Synergistaceae bacterium]